MARSPRLRLGDVFRLMPFEGRHGYGQIVATYGNSGGHFYFGVFKAVHTGGDPPLARVTEDDFGLLALSMDALLHHGHWAVVGNAPVPANRLRLREYKVATAPGVYSVVDAAGDVVRAATTKDVALLPYREVVAPIRLQHAFEALHGVRDWQPEYDALRVATLPL